MTPEEEIIRGNEAAIVIGSPVYKEAMMALRGQMMEEFTKTSYDQSEQRDEIWRTMKVLDAIEAKLKYVMTTGRIAQNPDMQSDAPH